MMSAACPRCGAAPEHYPDYDRRDCLRCRRRLAKD